MKHNIGKNLIRILLVMLLLGTLSVCSANVSTSVILRNTKIVQSPVVNVGEDLSMEVVLDGVEPASYQWYFNDAPISGAEYAVYSIVDAVPENSGVYRVDAFDENGKMLVSMDINARVIDPTVPKSGDASLPLELVGGIVILAFTALFMVYRRRADD